MSIAPAITPAAPPAPARVDPHPRLAPVPDPAGARQGATEPFGTLPQEWDRLDAVTVGGHEIDLVLIGPNGLFAVHVDPDLRPAAVRPGVGLVRAGARRPEPVKRALAGAAALRREVALMPGAPFPYPVLVTATPGEDGHRLGRLLAVRPGRLAEVLWSHVSRPLLRSQRVAIRRALEEPGG